MAEQRVVPAVVEEDLFAHIDDLLDFPDDAAVGGVLDGWGPGSELLCSDELLPAGSGSDFSRPDSVEDSDLAAGLSVPTEDIPELAWLSSFVEDSFSGGCFGFEQVENNQTRRGKDVPLRTSSPISVLDSTSSTSSGKFAAPLFVPNLRIPTRARTKRPRRKATVQYRRPLLMVSPTSSTGETDPYTSLRAPFLNCANLSLELDSYGMLSKQKKAFKKKGKSPRLFVAADHCDAAAQPVRKCTHCEIQKTPQWRAGPMGPKTLCNACGVRYKSGRLFPEYRPAASPTYVSACHSNSHKKVLEMRNQMGQSDPAPLPQVARKTSPLCSSSGTDAKNSWLIGQKMAA